ncbi:methyltransferase [Aureococcus anophagefferens]|nr:methyltransferase [Aureococcus anophagefferens]
MFETTSARAEASMDLDLVGAELLARHNSAAMERMIDRRVQEQLKVLKTELREELARGDGAAAPRRASRRESNAGRLSLSGRIMGTGNTIGGADDARDCLFDKASESYYFRVQTMVLFNEPSPRLALHVVVVVVAMMLQLFALSTVWQTIWFPVDVARWGVDDQAELEYFPSGLPRPTNYAKLLEFYNDTNL